MQPRPLALPKGAVLLVAEPLTPGGISLYARSLTSGLSAHGISHPLITSTPPHPDLLPPEEWCNVRVVGGLFWSVFRPFIFRKLAAWAREQEVFLIHGLSAVTAPVCSRLAQELNAPFIVTVHHYQERGTLRVEKNCAGFIAVSDSLRENIVNDARIPKELVRVVPAGIAVPGELRPRPASYQAGVEQAVSGESAGRDASPASRAAEGTVGRASPPAAGPTIPLVSAVGKLIARKDFRTYLNAARVIVDRLGPEISFILCGDGPDESELRKLARQLKIDKQVTFCHGGAPNEELLRDTDVYVQSSRTEGFGSMVLQAMAHGVPVVATSTGGLLSLVKDGETGFLVPVGDYEALAARVLNLLADSEMANRLGENARRVALEKFNLDVMMSRTLEVYAQAVESMAAK